MPARLRRLSRPAWTSIAFVLAITGCAQLETDRIAPPQTLGAAIFEVLCQRIAAEELPNDVSASFSRGPCRGSVDAENVPSEAIRLRALVQRRARAVEALDALLPESLESQLHRFMVDLVPFYEPPTPRLPEVTRALAGFLGQLAADEEALGAIARTSPRRGYAPSDHRLGILRPLLSHPDLDAFAKALLDAVGPGGPAAAPFDALLEAIAFEAATADFEASSSEPSTFALARELLMTDRATFGAGDPLPLVVRDRRGWAVPRDLEPPFADRDSDRLADVDDQGRFVDVDGAPFIPAAPFPVPREEETARDSLGRALAADQSPLYRTVDVDRTLLAGMLRELRPSLEAGDGHLVDVIDGLRVLLGPERERERAYGGARASFVGFDTDRGPLFDLLHGVSAILDAPETDDGLDVLARLLRDHEEVVAGAIDAALYVDARSDRAPGDDAHLEPDSELWDDVLEVLARITREPGLTEAVLRSLADPRVARLGPIFSEMMRHRDPTLLDPDDVSARRRAVDFTLPVDRTAPNLQSNASVFQRSLSIIHDLSGVRLCNKDGATLSVYGEDSNPDPIFVYPFFDATYAECELLEIDDLVYFYAKSVLGRGEITLNDALLNGLFEILRALSLGNTIDDIFVALTGIDEFDLTPTPEAIHRFIHGPWNRTLFDLTNPVTTRDGAPVKERHPEMTLVGWEREYLFCPGNVPVSQAAMSAGMPPCEPSSIERITFVEAIAKVLEAFDDFDSRRIGTPIDPREAGTSRPLYLFGELITALHLHWATPEHDRSQSSSASQPFFSFQSGASRYEPILADAFAECLATRGGACTEPGGRLLRRIHDLARALEGIEVRAGVDGITAMARLLEVLVDAERHPELRDRAGRRTTTTNAGRRTVALSPMYLILDALDGMDRAFETAPAVHSRWLAARSRLVDALLSARCDDGVCAFGSERTREAAIHAIAFLRARIAAHRVEGDLSEWARSLPDRLAETLDDPLPAATLRLVGALAAEPAVRSELEALLARILADDAPNAALRSALVTITDVLQWYEADDPRLLARALSTLVAPNVREAVMAGGALRVDDGTLSRALDLLRGILATDHPDRRVLRAVLAELVRPSLPEGESPLEALLDILVEVHREASRVGAGSPLSRDDASSLATRTKEFLDDDFRGLERLYRVVEARQLERTE